MQPTPTLESAVCTRASTAQHEPRGKRESSPFPFFPLPFFVAWTLLSHQPGLHLSPRGVVDDCTAVVAVACAGSLGVCLCSVLQVAESPFFLFFHPIPSHPILQVGWLVCTVVGKEKYLPLLLTSAGATCPLWPLVNSLPWMIDDTTSTKPKKLAPRLPDSRVPYQPNRVVAELRATRRPLLARRRPDKLNREKKGHPNQALSPASTPSTRSQGTRW